MTDAELLEAYVARGSAEAFGELTGRHAALVYSVCLRTLGDAHEAEDAAQAVFIALARSAKSIRRGAALPAWLYATARLAAGRLARERARRTRREKEAADMKLREDRGAPGRSWETVGPALDEAVAALAGRYREAVVLHYFAGRPVREVAAALGKPESTIKSLLSRAVGQLRGRLARKGVAVPAAALAGLMAEKSIAAVPAGLAGSLAAAALGKGAASAAALSLAEGTIKAMLWIKIKVAAAIVSCTAAAAGAGGLAVKLAKQEPPPVIHRDTRPVRQPHTPARHTPAQPAAGQHPSASASPEEPGDIAAHHGEPQAQPAPSPGAAGSEWSRPQPLSGDGAIGSPGGTHPLAVAGDTVHAVWVQGGIIQYRKSTDAGASWGETRQLTRGGTAAYPCSLELSGETLHLIWPDNRNGGNLGGNLGEIYSKRSTDGGKTWGPDVRVAPGMNFFRIGTAISGADIHLAWNEQTDPIPNPANYRWYKGAIWYKRSTDGGKTWGPNVPLTAKNDYDHGRPAVTAAGKCVHVAWLDGRDAQKDVPWDNDIYYARSTDGGVTWGPNIRMNNDPGYMARHPQIVTAPRGQVCLIYEEGSKFDPATKVWSGDAAMYARVSSDNGESWGKAKRISFVNTPNGRATHAKAFAAGSRIHLVWTDAPEGSTADPIRAQAAYYAASPDGGLTWTSAERLAAGLNGVWAPAAVAGTESRAIVLLAQGEKLYVTIRPAPAAGQPPAPAPHGGAGHGHGADPAAK